MPNINDVLMNLSGQFGETIHQRSLNRTPWHSPLVPRDRWPEGQGHLISSLTYDRSLPETKPTWSDISANTGSGNNCVPTASTIELAWTVQQYRLQQLALEGPMLCVNDLRSAFQAKRQLEAMYKVLSENQARVWADRNRDEYVRISAHKMIARAGLPEDDAAFPESLPTSRNTAGIMNTVYHRLLRDNASMDGGSLDMVDGMPQFVVYTSPETKRAILLDDLQIREDLRYADAPELLKPFGPSKPYNGYFYIADINVQRWTFDDEDGWVEVLPEIAVATTEGDAWLPNPDYETAPYEDTTVFLPTVYRCLVPDPISSPGGGTQFNPLDYSGMWRWLNIPDRTNNPDGTLGNYRGVYMCGSEPVSPQFGYVIRHQRPNTSRMFVDANGNPVA